MSTFLCEGGGSLLFHVVVVVVARCLHSRVVVVMARCLHSYVVVMLAWGLRFHIEMLLAAWCLCFEVIVCTLPWGSGGLTSTLQCGGDLTSILPCVCWSLMSTLLWGGSRLMTTLQFDGGGSFTSTLLCGGDGLTPTLSCGVDLRVVMVAFRLHCRVMVM